MRASTWVVVAALAAVACATGDVEDAGPSIRTASAPQIGPASVDDPIMPLPEKLALDQRKVELGSKLFRDPILDREKQATCLTCHPFGRGGVDGAPKPQLPGKEAMTVNTPTIFNVGLNYRQHWNGKFETLEAQLDAPILNPRVMNMTYPEVVARLSASPEYAAAFRDIYPDGVTEKNFRDALAEYERSLITPRSPFDRFLAGDPEAIDDRVRKGYALFKSHGCISCHQGVNIGGNMMQRFGALKDYFAGREISEADLGLFLVTRREEDKHVFRVASLRNVALTAPYFHDGSVKTLEEAVRIMSEYQLGRPLDDEQTKLIVAFLGSLTGDLGVEL